jgi:signal transduction histidine kinase
MKPKEPSAFLLEEEIAEKIEALLKNKTSSPEQLLSALQEITLAYRSLLNETRLLTRVSDRLQSKLRNANQSLQQQSEHLTQVSAEATEAKNRAQESEKFKEQFLANMSHEIRTPMNAILGLARLLVQQELLDVQKKYVKGILHSGEHLLVIINDILDLSKIEAGKMEFEKIPFSPAAILNEIADTFQLKVKEKNIFLDIQVSDNLPESCIGDPVRLRQVLLNLASNAFKFTTQGGITLRVLNINDRLRFEVEDTGIGISQEQQSKIFESYQQANTDTTRKFGGTGLGLTISRSLIQQQGGEIGLSSTVGKGTLFYVELPLQVNSTFETPKQETQVSKPSLPSGLRVLIAEDNPFNQMVIEDTLALVLESPVLKIVENGAEAVQAWKQEDWDVLLMDINMPVMDGYAATREIRSLELVRTSKQLIIAMTAGVTAPEIEACLAAGMDAVVGKPFEPNDLLNLIQQNLNSPSK